MSRQRTYVRAIMHIRDQARTGSGLPVWASTAVRRPPPVSRTQRLPEYWQRSDCSTTMRRPVRVQVTSTSNPENPETTYGPLTLPPSSLMPTRSPLRTLNMGCTVPADLVGARPVVCVTPARGPGVLFRTRDDSPVR